MSHEGEGSNSAGESVRRAIREAAEQAAPPLSARQLTAPAVLDQPAAGSAPDRTEDLITRVDTLTALVETLALRVRDQPAAGPAAAAQPNAPDAGGKAEPLDDLDDDTPENAVAEDIDEYESAQPQALAYVSVAELRHHLEEGHDYVSPHATDKPSIVTLKNDPTHDLLNDGKQRNALEEYRTTATLVFYHDIIMAEYARQCVDKDCLDDPACQRMLNSMEAVSEIGRSRLAFIRIAKEPHKTKDDEAFISFSRAQYFNPALSRHGSSKVANDRARFDAQVRSYTLQQAAKIAAKSNVSGGGGGGGGGGGTAAERKAKAAAAAKAKAEALAKAADKGKGKNA